MSAYAKGASAEHRLMADAFASGCMATRAAGSHGSDVLVCAYGGGERWAVNVKRGRWAGPNERRDHLLYADYGWRPLLARLDLVGGKGMGPIRLAWSFAIVTKTGGYDALIGAPWAS